MNGLRPHIAGNEVDMAVQSGVADVFFTHRMQVSTAQNGWLQSLDRCFQGDEEERDELFLGFWGTETRFLVLPFHEKSWSSFCFSKGYARGWIRQFLDTIRLNPPHSPPWRLVTLRLWVQPPSVHRVKNSSIYSVFCITGL